MQSAPEQAARTVVKERYPEARVALLAGSVVRGEATATSDLDLVIVRDDIRGPYRESFTSSNWPVEAFVHTENSWRAFFASDAQRRRPSLPRMCAEGWVLVDRGGLAAIMKREAAELLKKGPEPLSEAELSAMRYHVTDLLDDFVGSRVDAETYFSANELALAAADLLLVTNGHWLGRSKWAYRALQELHRGTGDHLAEALEAVYRGGSRAELTRWVDDALGPSGGRLFDHFRVG